MALAVISLSRRHVLGTLHDRCDELAGSIPVYIAADEPELVGYVDEPLGHFADAFSFHLDADSCKRLAAGHYTYSVGYEHTDPALAEGRSRVKLTSITLTAGKNYSKPVKIHNPISD